MENKNRRLAESAIMIAVAVLLGYVKIFTLPYGGSVTLLSMLPLAIIAFKYGTKWGIFTGIVYGLLYLMLNSGELNGVSTLTFFGAILLDFIMGFGSMGLVGMFKRRVTNTSQKIAVWFTVGVSVAMFVKFLFHFISGILLWWMFAHEGESAFMYSLIYNGTFMLPELIITSIGAFALANMKSFRQNVILPA